MMIELLRLSKDKSAVSNMVAYVLLVSVMIGMSVLVYGWLRFYVGDEYVKRCPSSVDVIVSSYECYDTTDIGPGRLKVALKNKGRFVVDGYTLRVHDEVGAEFGFYVLDDTGVMLAPGEEREWTYSFADFDFDGHNLSTITLIEVQPFVNDGEDIGCRAQATQAVSCYNGSSSAWNDGSDDSGSDSGGDDSGGGSSGGGSGGGDGGGGDDGGDDDGGDNGVPVEECEGLRDRVLCDVNGICIDEICTLPTLVMSCTNLNQENSYYALGQDISYSSDEDCIVISAENVFLDCMGYSITGSSDLNNVGIYSNQSNTTIKGCNVDMGNDGVGLDLFSANGSYIFNNTFSNQGTGMRFTNVNDAVIEENVANDNSYAGIYAMSSYGNVLRRNVANGNSQYGLFMDELTMNNNLIDNTFCNSAVDMSCDVVQPFGTNWCGSGTVCGGTCLACSTLSCVDGTENGDCSTVNPPLYCDLQSLVFDPNRCGADAGKCCQSNKLAAPWALLAAVNIPDSESCSNAYTYFDLDSIGGYWIDNTFTERPGVARTGGGWPSIARCSESVVLMPSEHGYEYTGVRSKNGGCIFVIYPDELIYYSYQASVLDWDYSRDSFCEYDGSSVDPVAIVGF